MKKGQLILIPSALADTNSARQFPQDTLDETFALKHFVTERAKTARHFLKAIGYPHHFSEVEVMELNKHGEDDLRHLLQYCEQGIDTGLISEAGVPGVADPGGIIVREAHRRGIEIVPLIGPSSLLLALMGSGMNGQNFHFHGYLPREDVELIKTIKTLEAQSRQEDVTQMFIETPYRNDKLLPVLLKHLSPQTDLCVAANLTAPNESIVTKSVELWKKSGIVLGKKPAVFLLFSGKLHS